jgi:hypothetical protein
MKTTDGNAVVTRVVTTGDESPESHTLTRLDSWKDIAHYLNRNVRTVQRWEMLEAMPVHRHCHDTGHSVYAYKQEIDAWRSNRSQEKRPTVRVSSIRQTPLGSLARAEQPALLRLLEVIAEHLHVDLAQSIAGLPADDSLGQGAATQGLVVAEDLHGLRPAERTTIRDMIGTRSFVACRRLKVDQ